MPKLLSTIAAAGNEKAVLVITNPQLSLPVVAEHL
jgi:hypothetical protein